MEPQCLIWSNEHRAWWKPNSLGYTTNIERAGAYDLTDAMEICERATLDWKRAPNEVSVRIDDLPDDAKVALGLL